MIFIFDNFSISMEYQKDSTFDRGKETTAIKGNDTKSENG